MSAPMPVTAPGDYRFFCGRWNRGPWYPSLSRTDGEGPRRWHPGALWDRWTGRMAVYTCRKPRTHWRATVKPPGLRWVIQVHDTKGADVPEQIRVRRTPYWRQRYEKVTRSESRIQVPTDSWEVGHKYYFNRYEVLSR